ncbi:hypothetical protein AB1Y20_021537 [Prymnesium parvum]|uniref:Anaphase-promoting complex subunit 1 n=1 Tax=Prymnesium parvum TaxID=97485 RepID=A0AB34JIY4_PRYPA
MAKKKKSLSNSPAQPSTPSTTAEPGTPTTPSAASADTEAIDGSLTLQPVAALTPSPALSACLHWSSMRALGLTLGDAVHLRAVDAPSEQPCLLMRAWASARVAPRKVALPDEAHAALGGSPRGVRLWAAANPTGGGGLREATAAVLRQEPSDGVAAGGVEALLHGAAVCEGCVVPLKLYGQPLLLRVAHLSPPATAEQLSAPDGGTPQRPPLYQARRRALPSRWERRVQ